LFRNKKKSEWNQPSIFLLHKTTIEVKKEKYINKVEKGKKKNEKKRRRDRNKEKERRSLLKKGGRNQAFSFLFFFLFLPSPNSYFLSFFFDVLKIGKEKNAVLFFCFILC